MKSVKNRVILPKFEKGDPLYIGFFIQELTRNHWAVMAEYNIA
jgi:hypothetical protein